MDRIDNNHLYIEEPCGKCGNKITFRFPIFRTEIDVAAITDWQRCDRCKNVLGQRLFNKDVRARYAACKARGDVEEQEFGLPGEASSLPEKNLQELLEWARNALGNPIDPERLFEIWTILKAKNEDWADCLRCDAGPLLEATLDLLADAVIRTLDK